MRGEKSEIQDAGWSTIPSARTGWKTPYPAPQHSTAIRADRGARPGPAARQAHFDLLIRAARLIWRARLLAWTALVPVLVGPRLAIAQAACTDNSNPVACQTNGANGVGYLSLGSAGTSVGLDQGSGTGATDADDVGVILGSGE